MMALEFALNHVVAPHLPIEGLFGLADELAIRSVEIRNDLEGQAIADGTTAVKVREAADERRISILSINALQRFNDWNREREMEARRLAEYARDCGAMGLVLVPVNDGTPLADGERRQLLRNALGQLGSILEDAGIRGLVEPLGFPQCSLRYKREAVDAIFDLGLQDTFRLVHDTFHHALSEEAEFFPDMTGLVHVSGARRADTAIEDLQDADRGLVDEADRLGNLEQVRALRMQGYDGALSFEPFAPDIHVLTEPGPALRSSMEFLQARLQP